MASFGERLVCISIVRGIYVTLPKEGRNKEDRPCLGTHSDSGDGILDTYHKKQTSAPGNWSNVGFEF